MASPRTSGVLPRLAARGPLAAVTAAAVGLLACFLLDRPVYEILHEHWNYRTRPAPPLLVLPTRLLRGIETWGENYYLAAIAFVIWTLDRGRRSRALALVLAAVLTAGIVEAGKRVFSRERPQASDGRGAFLGPAHFFSGGDLQSFPSGHAASAGSLSGSLAAFYPPLRPVAAALAVGCGASRVWKERHFLSDALAGGILGFWIGASLCRWRWFASIAARFDARDSSRRVAASLNPVCLPKRASVV